MKKSKIQRAAQLLAIFQTVAFLVYWFIGRTHENQMMMVKPWLDFGERLGVFALIITGFALIYKGKFCIGMLLVMVADCLILANQMSINDGYFLNVLFSFWDAAILLAMWAIGRSELSNEQSSK